MTLEMRFDCRAFNPDKTPDLRVGAHLILDDGCMVDLAETNQTLSDSQKQALLLGNPDDNRRKRLLFLNTKLVDRQFDSQGILKIFCPTCENEYTLTRQQYQEALDRFTRGELEPYIIT